MIYRLGSEYNNSFEKSKSSIKFYNHSAETNFKLDEKYFKKRKNDNEQYIVSENLDKIDQEGIVKYKINEVFEYFENLYVKNIQINDAGLKLIENHESVEESYEGSKYFAVKTIQVEWESHQHAFMHVFINVSNVKKLEKAKATNK